MAADEDRRHAGSPSYTHLPGEPNAQPKIATILWEIGDHQWFARLRFFGSVTAVPQPEQPTRSQSGVGFAFPAPQRRPLYDGPVFAMLGSCHSPNQHG